MDSGAARESEFLAELLDGLAEDCPEARDAILEGDPTLAERHSGDEELRRRMRAVLAETDASALTPEQAQVRREIETTLARLRRQGETELPDRGRAEPPGILTALTRELPPAKAMELFRKIAPSFVYQILDCLNRDASIGAIRRLVDHLCDESVLDRLRASEHVRDGILEEVREALGRSDVCASLTRADLERLLHESGAMHDLIAMENCIKLSAKAG